MVAIVSKETPPLTAEEVRRMNAYWRAANYLSVGQIYLHDNPLLREPLKLEHVKPQTARSLGHDAGAELHLRAPQSSDQGARSERDLHRGAGARRPGLVANTYLEGTYSEFYPNISQDAEGLKKLFKQFSFPGGIPSHVAPETPGSIHEGGELGYALVHAYGAVFDNPDLLAACVIGDGEAETGPLAASWHSNKFLNPARDGAVLPILHLNGYKIANPTVLARMSEEELTSLFVGYGYKPYFVEGDDPETMHQLMAATLDTVIAEIQEIQKDARAERFLATPAVADDHSAHAKRLDGTEVCRRPADGKLVPLASGAAWQSWPTKPEHLKMLEEWMRSYRPEELFDENGKLRCGVGRAGSEGRASHGSQPACQRRIAAQRI